MKSHPVTLCFDVGGTGIKAMLLDARARPLSDRVKVPTPKAARPKDVLAALRELAEQLPGFDRISCGFPAVVKNGVTGKATNLGKGWEDFPLAEVLARTFHVPVRAANDADVQGMGVITGRGTELVLTLGTGLGSALFHDGTLVPNLQLSHQVLRDDATYEDLLGRRAFEKAGRDKWNRRIRDMIPASRRVFSWDQLYLGGGNSKHVELRPGDFGDELMARVHIVGNGAGLTGGVRLWSSAGTSVAKRPRLALVA